MTSTLGMRDLVCEARLLGAGDQMVEEHPDAAVRSGPEFVEHHAQVVGAVETLDDDTFDAEVVAPHLLDQLGVVHSFHQDPRRARDAGTRADDGAAPGGRTCGGGHAGTCEVWRLLVRPQPVATSRTAVPSTANAPA